jgi:hypothetical protein
MRQTRDGGNITRNSYRRSMNKWTNYLNSTQLVILFSYGKQSTAGISIPAFSLCYGNLQYSWRQL